MKCHSAENNLQNKFKFAIGIWKEITFPHCYIDFDLQ